MLKKTLNARLLSTLILCLLCVTSTSSIAAGFHYQLNLTARLVTTPEGLLSGIEMSWLYDQELSTILMDGEDLSVAKREETLQNRAADILEGLLEMNYFTALQLDNNVLPTAEVEQYNLKLTDTSQLQLNLTLPLAQPQYLNGHQLQVIVSDPTAVGLATFLTADHLLLNESLMSLCQKPTLQQNQLATNSDHILLSETMTVDCR